MSSEDEDEDEEDHRYTVQISEAKHLQQDACNKMKDTGKKSRSNAAGRLKRVVSCKRKTHHHHHYHMKGPGAHRRASTPVKPVRETMREDKPQHSESLSHWRCCSQISEEHHLLTDVLHGRNLRLSLALTLWRRSTGELLSFLERLQDVSVLVDCLPALTRSLQEETLGFCVDLFPLVKNLLESCFEDYIISALIWIHAALERWSSRLIDNRQSSDHRNIGVLKQQLQELWTLKTHLTSASQTTADFWKAVESHLIQL
ncbi:KATNB1-like protein 1 [Garra rufa]|uniref:KATNB1-like protein 1 n=1 Tax=Garra rufa TaxID=137080 RepID=UPI003CCECA8F